MRELRGAWACAIFSTILMAQTHKLTYPDPKKSDVTDDYHGQKIADPYRWLEDTDSADTAAWVAAENRVTSSFFEGIPERDRIQARLTELFNFEKYPALALNRYAGAFQRHGQYFVFRNDGLQNQDVLYTFDSLSGPQRVLLDPNKLREDGTAALAGVSVSRDGRLLAYAVSEAGSDWSEWRVRKIENGRDLVDTIRWTKFTAVEWTLSSDGFYYQRFPEPEGQTALTAANTNAKIYFHKLGQPQSADTLVYERPDHPDWHFFPQLSHDGRFLMITVQASDFGKNLLFYQDLRAAKPKTIELIAGLTGRYEFLGTNGSQVYLLTTEDAPRGRIVLVDLARPARERWKTIVPEREDVIDAVQLADGKLVVSYLADAHSKVRVFDLQGKPSGEVALPGLGTVHWSPADQGDSEVFYSYGDFTSPPSLYLYNLRTGANSAIRKSKLSFDPSRYETKQVFYASKDGTRVPMFLVYQKGLQLNGQNPTLLYGYGGFNIALTPSFNPGYIGWMEMGGVLAVANLRGGSEYGEAWHLAGTKLQKQNVFDDFIAAAEWLIANRYTSTPKLAIYGGSNGGLLVGAVLNQRPELFGAAMPAVGVMDMLRFHRFTVGATWTGDYGSPDNPDEFRAIRAYSPLHTIRRGVQYPPVLITTSDHDDRVVPGHSFKYAATLQAAQEGPAPILIRVETRAGHGAGTPTSKRIEEYADRWAFLRKSLMMNTSLVVQE